MGRKKVSPFDYLKALTGEKRDLIREEGDDTYNPFVVNRALSYHAACVMYSNEMNQHHHIDNKPQHDYYMGSLPKRNLPFIKWGKKPEADGTIRFIMELMGYSREKAENAYSLMPESIITRLEKEMESRNVS